MSSQHHNQHNAATERRQQQRQSTDEAHQQCRNRIIVNENHCYAYAMPTFAQHSHRRPPNHIQQHDCTKCWRSTQTPASSSSVVWTLGLAVVMMICLQSCFSSIVRVQANTIAASDNLTTTAMVFAPSSSSGAAEPAEPQAVIDNGSSAVYQLHQYEDPSAARNGTNASSDCQLERGCLLCAPPPHGRCVKCVHYITADERRCVLECPRGYIEQWSNTPDLLGIVCQPNGYADPMLATVVSLTIVACLCVLLVVGGVLAVRRKQRQKGRRRALIDETIERDDFLKQLAELRPNAEYFLAMLNDTRRQIRKLFLAGDQAGANAYRTIVRDLAKVLILLNRPVELISRPPHDWPRVYAWARRILDRCKPQLVQLIDFLHVGGGGAGGGIESTPSSASSSSYVVGRGGDGAGGGIGTTDASSSSAAAMMMMMMDSSQYSTFKSTATKATTMGGGGGGDGSPGSDSPDDAKRRMHAPTTQLFGSLISLHDLHAGEPNGGACELRSTNPFHRASFGGGATLKGNAQAPVSDVHGSSMWLEDEFFKLGFRPQDEITTEL